MREEPGERVFDIPSEPPVRPQPSLPTVEEPPQRAISQPAIARPSAPKATAPAPSGGTDGTWWRALAENCKGRISPMYRPFLGKCYGVLDNGQLVVYAPDEITLNRIDNDRVRAALTEEASAAAGQSVGLSLRVGDPPKRDPKENLQNLLAFASKHENIQIK